VKRLLRLVVFVTAAIPVAAYAQLPIPPSAEPRPPAERAVPPERPREAEPAIRVQPLPGSQAPPGAEQVEIDLRDIAVEGATAYSPEELRALFAPYLGKRVSIAKIFELAHELETKYWSDGYVLTRIIVPEQEIEGGRVKFTAVEGWINAVAVEGEPGPLEDAIKRQAEALTKQRPARIEDIERFLLLVDDMPGVTAQGVIRPGKEAGASELVVDVKVKHVDGYVTVNNRASRFTGPIVGAVGVGVNSFTPLAERVEGIFYSTFDDEQQFGQLAVSGRILDNGTRLRAFVGYTPSNPGFTLDPLDVESTALTAGLHATVPVVRSRRTNLALDFGFDFEDTKTEILEAPFSKDHLRVLRVVATADHRDDWRGITSGALGLHQGLAILGASEHGSDQPSRAEGRADFFKATAEISRLQALLERDAWSLGLFGSLGGQYATSPLLAPEEFAPGGERFGRGYFPAEISGDSGFGTSIELRFTHFLENAWVPHYQVYAFYDFAAVWNRDSGTPPRETLASSGLGTRFDVTDFFSGELEMAVPLTRPATGNEDNDARFFFRVTARF
jgi:hemolysin activation/secretion protein